MFQKLVRKGWLILRLVLRITRVLKYEKINRMMRKVIYGVLDVFCMKWLHLILLLEPRICRGYIERSLEGNTQPCHQDILQI